MSARIYFKGVADSVLVERIMQLARIHSQAVLISNIDGDRTILPKVSNVLIYRGKRGIGRPFGENVELRLAVLRRQVEEERRVFRIGRPSRGTSKHCSRKERQLGGILWSLHGLESLLYLRV